MRNWIRTAVISTIVAFSGGAAWGFDANSVVWAGTPLGTCTVHEIHDGSRGIALVMIIDPSTRARSHPVAGGVGWPLIGTRGLSITVADIATCLGVEGNGYVISLTQNGAELGGSYLTQEYMGFSFTLTEAAGGLDAGYHENYVGPPPDGTPPTVELGALALQTNGTYTSAITLSEETGDGTAFDGDDLTLTNATATLSGSGTSFTATLTPNADGVVSLYVGDAAFSDAAGNDNTAATQVSATFDTTAPTVMLFGPSELVNRMFILGAWFDDVVEDFVVEDITVVNGVAQDLVAITANAYVFNVVPANDGTVTVDVAVGMFNDAAGNANTEAAQFSVNTDSTNPTVALTGPSGPVTGAFDVSAKFSENVIGLTEDEIAVEGGAVTSLSGSDADYTITIEPELGATVTVTIIADAALDDAGNGNDVSNTYTVQAGSPASEFEAAESEIRDVLVGTAQRSLHSKVISNQRMTQDARSRFITSQRQQSEGDAGISSCNNVALDLDGFARIDGAEFTAKSSFFEQTGNFEGTQRRLVFGDFDVQRDESGSTTGSFNGKVAWERNISETAMLGYYLGGTLGKSDLKGTFEGKQSQYGASVGAYVVAQISDALFIDGFASLGAARNSLEMDNGTLALTSDYITRTATVGGALTGIIEQEAYEIRPELAFSYGKTSIGNVDFTGTADSETDDTLNLDAGTVSIASLTFRPEFYVPISESAGLGTNAMFTFAPRLICERVITDATTQNCGRGGEIGVSNKSDDGLTDLSVSYKVDYIGDSKRSGLVLNLSHKF